MWKSTPDQYGRVAIAIHWVSALLIVALLVSGFRADATVDAIGGDGAGPLPDFETFFPRTPHGIGARLMLALFALHVGAALYHHFIRRDGLLRRMGIRL
tara:strand:+ start:59558 stop:59854 length:297 start_codon:yes stop_codon:yes gene_type:complete